MRRIVIAYSGLRIAYALALLAAPARTARPWVGAAAAGPAGAIALRGLGARDLALAAGALTAAISGGSVRPWLAACAAGDAVDLTATLITDDKSLPRRAKSGTVAAAGGFGMAAVALAAWGRR